MRKPVIVFDIASSRRGGPFVACRNIEKSALKDKYEFREIVYNNNLGRFISRKRIRDLKQQIEKIKPDAIIITGLQLSCFHVCVAAIVAGVKTRIITIHGSSLEALSLSGFKKFILYWVEFLSLMMCTSFYGVSKYAAQLSAGKWFKKRNRGHVYNLITPQNQTHSKLTREDLGLKRDDIVVISSGRIIKEKGYEVLAEAIKGIDASNIKFLILGDGNYLSQFKDYLSQEIQDKRVICMGFREKVYDYLRISDIFILPTLHETLSVSLLEASAAGLPMISCSVGGVPEVIENDCNGRLVEAGNPVALRNAVIELADNPEKRMEMGRNATARLNTVFCNDKSIRRLEEIIDSDLQRWVNE